RACQVIVASRRAAGLAVRLVLAGGRVHAITLTTALFAGVVALRARATRVAFHRGADALVAWGVAGFTLTVAGDVAAQAVDAEARVTDAARVASLAVGQLLLASRFTAEVTVRAVVVVGARVRALLSAIH